MDVQVVDHEGGRNHQQMDPESAGLVQDAARLKGGGRCHRHGDDWPPVLMLITANHRYHDDDSRASDHQDVHSVGTNLHVMVRLHLIHGNFTIFVWHLSSVPIP